MASRDDTPARLPPRPVIKLFWRAHRALYRLSRGRWGLSRPKPGRYGMLRLRTIGRHSGLERVVILGYMEAGPDLVTLAMNGWDDPQPAWWLNLLANPDAEVDLVDGPRPVRAREAHGEERERLWNEFRGYGSGLDKFAALRTTKTAVVVIEPRT